MWDHCGWGRGCAGEAAQRRGSTSLVGAGVVRQTRWMGGGATAPLTLLLHCSWASAHRHCHRRPRQNGSTWRDLTGTLGCISCFRFHCGKFTFAPSQPGAQCVSRIPALNPVQPEPTRSIRHRSPPNRHSSPKPMAGPWGGALDVMRPDSGPAARHGRPAIRVGAEPHSGCVPRIHPWSCPPPTSSLQVESTDRRRVAGRLYGPGPSHPVRRPSR